MAVLVYAVTTNPGKLRELQAAAEPLLQLTPLSGLPGIHPPEETGTTFEENAILKARYYSSFTEELVLCDDSGLEVDALYGAPGVYSARFAGEDATDEDNNNLLLRQLSTLAVRTARFVCVVALGRAGQIIKTARGTVEGQIAPEPRGAQGFGYDPLFFYPPSQRTFGELTAEEKLSVSHRGRAVRALTAALQIL